MDFAAQLRVLQAAQGDPAKLALATVDLAFPDLADTERAALKEALQAAAVPHWCDAGILAALLEVGPEEGSARLAQLRKLTVVEPFPARGDSAVNVHETARLALRRWLAAERPDWFRQLSERMTSHFHANLSAAGRVEWIYHLLSAEPERGTKGLERLDREWASGARPEDRYALVTAVKELEEGNLVGGAARVEVLLCVSETRSSRGETSQLETLAREALALARSVNHPSGEARANSLLGDALQAQGKLAEAQAAFGQHLSISQRLVEQDPDNAGWQRDLAVAHSQVGDTLRDQGKLAEAQAAFGERLTINQRLVDQDPGNAAWQRGLAVAHNRVGVVLEAQGKLAEAQAAFGEGLTINRWLVEQDPSNADWQRELAAAHCKVGDALQAQGKLAEAQAAFGQHLSISQRLVEQDPDNAVWRRELAIAHSRVGDTLRDQGKLAEAQAAFGETLTISRRLVDQDPGNAAWQRELAVTCFLIAGTHWRAGSRESALPLYEEAVQIFADLVERFPDFVEWREERKIIEDELASCRRSLSSNVNV